MSVNEEFLRELCENYAADWEFINQTAHPDDTQEAKEEAERSFQAILQHFRQEQEKGVGLMRQWLNEDRITDPKKLVTNEELMVWLDKGDKI